MDARNVMPNIRALVAESGLTQQVLGEKMGYPAKSARQSVSQFLKGANPTIEVLMRFCKATGVSVESLL